MDILNNYLLSTFYVPVALGTLEDSKVEIGFLII